MRFGPRKSSLAHDTVSVAIAIAGVGYHSIRESATASLAALYSGFSSGLCCIA